MGKFNNHCIKLKYNIDYSDYKDVKDLEKLCNEKDNTSLKLEMDYKLNNSENNNEKDLNTINEFMYYVNDYLIGYIGICQFSRGVLEVNGMVHPEYRRKNIFKRLFSLVKDEFNRRESKGMLLLSDNKSHEGLCFIKSITDKYDHSEYEMHLMDERQFIPSGINIVLRTALNEDKGEIARQNTIYFGDEFSEDSVTVPDTNNDNEFNFIAEIDNNIIGKVNLEINDGVGYIYGLGVKPEYRRNGYGREILLLAIDKLKEKGAQKIMLQVDAKNKNALNLYKSCGFKEINTMDYYKFN